MRYRGVPYLMAEKARSEQGDSQGAMQSPIATQAVSQPVPVSTQARKISNEMREAVNAGYTPSVDRSGKAYVGQSQAQAMMGKGYIPSDLKLGDLPWDAAPNTVAMQKKMEQRADYEPASDGSDLDYIGKAFRGDYAGKRMATEEQYLRRLRERGEDPSSAQGVPRRLSESGGVWDRYSPAWLDNVTRNWNGLQDENYYGEMVRYILGDEAARSGSLSERDSLGMSAIGSRIHFYTNALEYKDGPNGIGGPNGDLSPLIIDEGDSRASQKKMYNAAAFMQYLNARDGASLVNRSGRRSPFDAPRAFNGYSEAVKKYIEDGGQDGFEDFTLRYVDGNS